MDLTRNNVNANCNDDEKVEGRGPDDGSRPEAVGLKLLSDDLDRGEKNFWKLNELAARVTRCWTKKVAHLFQKVAQKITRVV